MNVDDVVAANMLASEVELPAARDLDGRGFNVGTGMETSVTELAQALMCVAGRDVAVDHAAPRRVSFVIPASTRPACGRWAGSREPHCSGDWPPRTSG